MRVLFAEPADADTRLEHSRNALRDLAPHLSSEQVLDRRQRDVLVWSMIALLAGLVIVPVATAVALVAFATIIYLATIAHRVLMASRSRSATSVVVVSDEDALAIPDDELPVYTVLVPMYHEAQVVPQLLAHLRALDYPRGRLDVKLLLEEDDEATIEAARVHAAADGIDLVLVPAAAPRTKPKALNYGLTFARGDLVTIYDAEDRPDPLQLRRAVVAFRRLPSDVACLQAELSYHNSTQNIITRWFTIEYAMWFTLFLPGLAASDAPLPLGGTSNHMKRSVLDSLGAWDAHNVTEDADLGIRLHRQGWKTGVLGSQTLEEGNSDFVNWVKQRSRWYKGYLATWLVHLRHPVELWRDLGPSGFVQFHLFVGGTPLLALLNPLFWLLTLAWFGAHSGIVKTIYPTPVYFAGLFCFVVGNLIIYYMTILAARISERPVLVLAACLVPAYWVMMSIAAMKAFWQLVAAPSYWEKTTHGLDAGGSDPAAAQADPELVGGGGAGSSHAVGPFSPIAAAPLTRQPNVARALRALAWGRALQVAGMGVVVFLAVLVFVGGWR
jgi:cellulose synthase/poly-beta-1,6-N-acetylglucosamine synthase-like glycosyltransferase